MKKVAIFGGTGWVGHNIANIFHQNNFDVTICTRGQKTTYSDLIAKDIKSIKIDKENKSDIENLSSENYDIIIDTVPTVECIDHVVEYFPNLERYLHCSSTGGYAPLPFVPGDETMPYNYTVAGWKQKAEVDSKVMNLFKQNNFPATVLRPSYITGEGYIPLDNLGGRREDFISDILEGKTLDLPSDGKALLHPVHVKDIANAFFLAVQAPISIGQIYNISLEKAVTLNRYLEINAEALGCKVKINHMSIEDMLKKYGESLNEYWLRFFAEHMCFDMRKAREHLNYHPHISTEDAIKETAIWTKNQMEK